VFRFSTFCVRAFAQERVSTALKFIKNMSIGSVSYWLSMPCGILSYVLAQFERDMIWWRVMFSNSLMIAWLTWMPCNGRVREEARCDLSGPVSLRIRMAKAGLTMIELKL